MKTFHQFNESKPSQGKSGQRVKASFEDREKRQKAERDRAIKNHTCPKTGPCLFRFCPHKQP